MTLHSQITTKIKMRKEPNDKFYTPHSVINKHLYILKEYIEPYKIIYEPFSGDGRYVKKLIECFPNNKVVSTEIDEGTNFFEYKDEVDYIITNPPYSLLMKVIEHCIELKPTFISLLIGCINLTPKRVKLLNDNGYYISTFSLFDIKGWFSRSVIITFSNKINKNIIDYDVNYYKN